MEQQTATQALPFLVDSSLSIQKLRVSTQVRCTHLNNLGKKDPECEWLKKELHELEKDVNGVIASHIENHPAYHWFSKVKGVGKENIAKVLGPLDIRKAKHVSSFWKFAGFHVDEKTGKAPKREPGKKLEYNNQLRSMCYRLAQGLLRGKGRYYKFYLKIKKQLEERYSSRDMKIQPTPQRSVGKRMEPEGVIWSGHLHNQAVRRMIKLFLSHLWVEWRKAEKLPVTKPYAIDKLRHETYYDPWEFIDR